MNRAAGARGVYRERWYSAAAMRPLRILYAGALARGQLARVRYDMLERPGIELHPFDFTPYEARIAKSIPKRAIRKFFRPVMHRGINRDLIATARRVAPDILYVDKGIDFERATLQRIREEARADGREPLLLHFHPDHAFHELLYTRAYDLAVPEYDCHFIPHDWVIDDHRERDAREIVMLPFGYDPRSHFREHEWARDDPEAQRTVFVGRWEGDRAGWLVDLAKAGVPVDVWGPFWPGKDDPSIGLRCRGGFADFAAQRRIYGRSAVSLGLLSNTNHDGHTSRTFEVPACGGFMLGERTTGQSALFEPDREMGAFVGPQELIVQARRWLDDPAGREAVREAGYRRCTGSGYDYGARMDVVLQTAARLRPDLAPAVERIPAWDADNPDGPDAAGPA